MNFEYCVRMPTWQLYKPKLLSEQVQDRDQLHQFLPPFLRKSDSYDEQPLVSTAMVFLSY